MFSESTSAQLTICTTDRPIQDSAFAMSEEFTGNGSPLLIIDAAGCFDPRRMSQSPADLATRAHIVRVSNIEELEGLWAEVDLVLERLEIRRVLVVGLLNHLYDPRLQTRDAARALGRIKLRFESLSENGVDVVVVCENAPQNLGTRSLFLQSLCASAGQVMEYRSGLLPSPARGLRRAFSGIPRRLDFRPSPPAA